jgi:hypothetical protein
VPATPIRDPLGRSGTLPLHPDKSGDSPASGSTRIDHGVVDLKRQHLDTLGESLQGFHELSVLLEHLHEKRRLLRRCRLPFLARVVQSLTMFRIGDGMSGITISLSGLRKI